MEQSSVPAEGGQQAPAGWYKDPSTGNDRYWDGQSWSVEQQVQKQDTLSILGWIFAVLIPIVGLILGIIVAAKGKVQTGLLIVGLSIVAAVLWYLLTNA
jgi:hypothetical protein